jgi:endogenous inhibitor of DNA gyrase (YacG/DUF329 family)
MDEDVREVTVTIVRRYQLTKGVCPVCGSGFAGSRLRVYCSHQCQRRAAWQRNGKRWNAGRKAAPRCRKEQTT